MSNTRSLIIVGAGETEQEAIRRQLDGVAEVVGAEPAPGRALPLLREKSASVALLYLDHDPDGVLSLSREIARSNGCAPIVVSRDRDPDTILLAMRSGVRDFAYLDDEEEDVRRAVMNLRAVSGEADEHEGGQVLAVFSSKGGSGATTLATNLAATLQAADGRARVVVVDLDLQMGDVLVFLDLASRYSLSDLLENLPRLDDELLHRSLTAHASGLRVLAQSDQLEEADRVDGPAVTRAVAFLRRYYDYVILDGLRDFGEHALAALDGSDRVLLTFTQDVPALKNASRCLSLFRRLGYGAEKVKLVLNRYHKRSKPDLDSIADALGSPIHGTVANDFPAAIRAINEGQLLVQSAPRARITRDIEALGRTLSAGAEPPLRAAAGRLP